jgi:hypothetical protein
MKVSHPNGWCLYPSFHSTNDYMVQSALPGFQGLCPETLGGKDWLNSMEMHQPIPLTYFELNPEHGANLLSVSLSFAIHPRAKLVVCNPKKRCSHKEEDYSLYGYEEKECPFCSDEIFQRNVNRMFDETKRFYYSTKQLRDVLQYLDYIHIELAYCNEVGLDCTENSLQDWLEAIWSCMNIGGVLICNYNDATREDVNRFLYKKEEEFMQIAQHGTQLFLKKK